MASGIPEPLAGRADEARGQDDARPGPPGVAGGGALGLALLTAFSALMFPGAAMVVSIIGAGGAAIIGGLAVSPDGPGRQSESSRALGMAAVILGTGTAILGLLIPVVRAA